MDNLQLQFDRTKREIAKIRLSEDEKEAMRVRLMHETGIAYVRDFQQQDEKVGLFAALFSNLLPRYVPAFLIALLVLGSGTGISFAADLALPTDFLYPMKVHFNEEIKSAFRVSSQAKLAYEIERSAQRLAETKVLQERDQEIAPAIKIEVANLLVLHAKDIEILEEKLRMQNQEIVLVVLHQSHIENLEANRDVIFDLLETAQTQAPHIAANIPEESLPGTSTEAISAVADENETERIALTIPQQTPEEISQTGRSEAEAKKLMWPKATPFVSEEAASRVSPPTAIPPASIDLHQLLLAYEQQIADLRTEVDELKGNRIAVAPPPIELQQPVIKQDEVKIAPPSFQEKSSIIEKKDISIREDGAAADDFDELELPFSTVTPDKSQTVSAVDQEKVAEEMSEKEQKIDELIPQIKIDAINRGWQLLDFTPTNPNESVHMNNVTFVFHGSAEIRGIFSSKTGNFCIHSVTADSKEKLPALDFLRFMDTLCLSNPGFAKTVLLPIFEGKEITVVVQEYQKKISANSTFDEARLVKVLTPVPTSEPVTKDPVLLQQNNLISPTPSPVKSQITTTQNSVDLTFSANFGVKTDVKSSVGIVSILVRDIGGDGLCFEPKTCQIHQFPIFILDANLDGILLGSFKMSKRGEGYPTIVNLNKVLTLELLDSVFTKNGDGSVKAENYQIKFRLRGRSEAEAKE